MAAKRDVCKAQDAWQRFDWEADRRTRVTSDPDLVRNRRLRERIRKNLARARGLLEDTDNAFLALLDMDNEHCNCGGFPDGKPHAASCPLGEAQKEGDP
jgi:hypothetical protein